MIVLRINFDRSLRTLPLRALSWLLGRRPRSISYDPYDVDVLTDRAEQLFRLYERKQPLGTIGRGRLILRIIEESFPTQRLAAAYFENLECLLRIRKSRKSAGQVLLGIGTGRSGSTSLTAMLATIEDSCCTHENPPLIFWTPKEEQVQFHIRRLKLLAEYFSLVVDVSHWWLNAVDSLFEHFPGGKVIGMSRDVDQCAKSFMRIKRYGRKSDNHWVAYGNSIWATNAWDPTYPSYSIPSGAELDPDQVKYELISRYVREYNSELTTLAARLPKRMMLVRTEELNDPGVQANIFRFTNATGRAAEFKLNVGTATNGACFKF